ncbi:MAG: molecular chaperone DnaJ [Malacoplasma sp.]
MAKRDYYEILGISRTADETEIKKSFRKKAMEFHPDRNKSPEADAKFKEVNEAYEVLSDSQKKATYDKYGHDGLDNQGFHSQGFDPFDIFNQFFSGNDSSGDFGSFGGGFGDIFGNIFGSQGRRASGFQQESQNINLMISLKITFIESILGISKQVEYKVENDCTSCKGTGASNEPDSINTCTTCNGQGFTISKKRTLLGMMQTQSVCPTCKGYGKIISKKCSTCKGHKQIEEKLKITIDVPPGISNDETLVLNGLGNKINGQQGNLYINVKVEPSAIFERRKNDLYVRAKIDPIVAIVGGEIEVPTPYGIKKISIPAGIANDDIITISEHGIKNSIKFSNSNGDLFAIIDYAKPNKYSAAELKEISKFIQENDEVKKYINQAKKEVN